MNKGLFQWHISKHVAECCIVSWVFFFVVFSALLRVELLEFAPCKVLAMPEQSVLTLRLI